MPRVIDFYLVILAWISCTLLAMPYPCCCRRFNCGPCCPSLPAALVADLGVGGWVNDACNDCDEVAGEWTLPFSFDGSFSCIYGDTFELGDCPGATAPEAFGITAELNDNTCLWTLQVQYTAQIGFFASKTTTVYQSTSDSCVFPVTMEKISEVNDSLGGGTCDISGGGLPATVYLKAA